MSVSADGSSFLLQQTPRISKSYFEIRSAQNCIIVVKYGELPIDENRHGEFIVTQMGLKFGDEEIGKLQFGTGGGLNFRRGLGSWRGGSRTPDPKNV